LGEKSTIAMVLPLKPIGPAWAQALADKAKAVKNCLIEYLQTAGDIAATHFKASAA
jgi:hypothetical protein